MRFIHIADVHLSAAPDTGFSWSRQRERDIWETFQRIIETVKEEKTELLLIAGDLFHRQPLLRELKEVNYLFSSIPDTMVVLIAGNHDYLKADSVYAKFAWNKNVCCLRQESCEAVYLKRLHTWVYGCSYHSREVHGNLYGTVRPNGEEGYHILVAHGGDESHSPLDVPGLSRAGFDYVALGHIHKPEILVPDQIAYAGSPEPIDRNELGMHGYIKGTCNTQGTKLEFVPFSVCTYIPMQMEVKEETTQYALEEVLREKIAKAGAENIYKIRLFGVRGQGFRFDFERLTRLGRIVELTDDTRVGFDYEALLTQYEGSLIGEYIRRFLGTEDEIEKKALEYGVQAMLEARREL